jgi:hypothetical protein
MKMMIEMKLQSSFRWRLMCAARDVGTKMTQLPNLIIVPVEDRMATPCGAATKMLRSFQSSFRWRLMRVAPEKQRGIPGIFILSALTSNTPPEGRLAA